MKNRSRSEKDLTSFASVLSSNEDGDTDNIRVGTWMPMAYETTHLR